MRLAFISLASLITLHSHVLAANPLDSFIDSQVKVAGEAVLSNIGGPHGRNAKGAADGAVIASPSRINPDYFYSWTRDSAITFQALIERFIHGAKWLEPLIKNYVSSVGAVQLVANPSGSLLSGGLGEPKFYPNQSAFNDYMPRPQRDGPALRASALIDYGFYIYTEQMDYVSETLWPLIQNDLNYLVECWNMTGFDLWGENNQSSFFFTTAVQHKALRQGFEFSSLMGTVDLVYLERSGLLLCFLQGYWNVDHISSDLQTNSDRSGIDASTILASIRTFSPDLGCDEFTFQPCSSRALSNHKKVVDSFRSIYPINSVYRRHFAVAIGRFPEDDYYDGNPWYLTTLAAAEQLYDCLYVWQVLGTIDVTPLSLEFFSAITPAIKVGAYCNSTTEFLRILTWTKNYADQFVSIMRAFTPPHGQLHQQFSKTDGMPLSAAEYTWSYVAFLTMQARRMEYGIMNWGNSLASLPTEAKTCEEKSPPPVDVITANFQMNSSTSTGNQAFLIGNIVELGSWNVENAIKMDRNSSSIVQWTVSVELPPLTSFQYKYIMEQENGTNSWETGYVRGLETPDHGNFTMLDLFHS